MSNYAKGDYSSEFVKIYEAFKDKINEETSADEIENTVENKEDHDFTTIEP